MKLLILALLFFITSLCQSQTSFELTGEIGQGFKFKDCHSPQFYMVNTTMKPGMSLGKVKAISILMSAFSDGYTYLFVGTGLSYQVFEKDKIRVHIEASALFGSEARKLYGANTTFEFEESYYISLNARQEYTRKEFWFDGGVGIKLY